jgi:hypothetical protein
MISRVVLSMLSSPLDVGLGTTGSRLARGAMRSPTHEEGARQSERPLAICSNGGLHLFLRARLGGIVPHAASFVATSLVGCFRHVSGKGGAGYGQCQGQSQHRS